MIFSYHTEFQSIEPLVKLDLPQWHFDNFDKGTVEIHLFGLSGGHYFNVHHTKIWSPGELKLDFCCFVFWMSQGCQFAFFKLTDGDDPPVYYYREYSGQNDYIIISGSLSQFLMDVLNRKRDLFSV